MSIFTLIFGLVWAFTHLNPFTPGFLKYTLPSLNFELSILVNKGFSKKIKRGMVNSVDPDETAHYELSHLDLHCLQKCLFESVWPKRVKEAILENVD